MDSNLPIRSTETVPNYTDFELVEPANRFSKANRWRAVLAGYGSALRRRWWIILLSVVIIGGGAAAYGWLKPPTYKSEATMWKGTRSRVSLPDIASSPSSDELARVLGTEIDLLKLDRIQQQAYGEVLRQFPTLPPETGARVPFKLKVHSAPTKSAVLELTAVGEQPDATRAFLDAVMKDYVEFKNSVRASNSGKALTSINQQIRELDQHLREQQAKIAGFQRSNNIAYLSERKANAGSQLARLEGQISDLRTELQVLGMLSPEEVENMKKGYNLGLPELSMPNRSSTRDVLPQVNASAEAYYQTMQRLQLLKAERDQFAAVLRPNHSKMIRLNQDIAGLEKLLKTLDEDDKKQTATQLAGLRKSLELQIQNAETQRKNWEEAAESASAKLAELEPLKAEMERSQTLYNRLLNLQQTVDLSENLDQDSLGIVQPASPARPTYSGLQIAIGGILFSLLAGVAMALFFESLNERFVTARELSLELPEEIVAQIPNAPPRKRGFLGMNGKEERNAFSEAFRSLRSSLLFMFEQGRGPKVMLLTSSLPEEGKTTIAANLGATLATTGARVLLIDADLRRSSLHRFFGVPQNPGLREVLHDQVSLHNAVVPVSLKDSETKPGANGEHKQKNLFLLPAGDASVCSSELFLGGQMDRLLEEVASTYDHVVIDTAPVLATDEASTLGPKADGVLLVVRGRHTSASAAREALDRLVKRHAKILGLIYNRAEPSSDYFYQCYQDYGAMKHSNRRFPLVVAT